MKDKIIRRQVSITKGELEVLETLEDLPTSSYEDAVISGIVKQIINKEVKWYTNNAHFYLIH